MKKVTIAIFFLMILGSLMAFAQEDSRRSTVEKLLLLTGDERLVDQMFQQITQMQMQQFHSMDIPQNQISGMEQHLETMFRMIREEITWDTMKDDVIDLYLSVYTEEEIEDLIEFYESPLGQKVVQKTPQFIQQSLTVSQKHIQRILPKIQAMTQEMIADYGDEASQDASLRSSASPTPDSLDGLSEEISEDGNRVVSSSLTILARAVWNFNAPLIEEILEFLITVNPSLMYADVTLHKTRDEHGQDIGVWRTKFRAGYQDYLTRMNEPMEERIRIHLLPITYHTDSVGILRLGTLRLVFSP
jgi:hypothetical protein